MMGKVMVVTVITAAVTSAATFLALRSLTGAGGPREVQVPDVTGLRLEEARATLDGRSLLLAISDTAEDPRLEAGRVVRQNPPSGASTRPGSEVRVVLSAGPAAVEVPSLLHLPLPTATELLTAVGLRVGEVSRREDDKEAAGLVIAAKPAPRERVARGGTVDLILSAGPAEAKVPSVLGRTQAQATELLTAAGFKLGRVSFGYDEDRRPGVVIRQTPAADSAAPRGSAVNLVMNEND